MSGAGSAGRLRGGVNKVGGFALSMALLAVVSLFSIPAMVAASGPTAIAAVVLGQAIGAVAAVLIHLGWAINGPSRIAVGSWNQRREAYLDSVRSRLVVLLPVGAAASCLAAAAAQSDRGLAALAAFSSGSMGLGSMWYFAGSGQPYRYLLVETIPRAVGTSIGIGFMLSGTGAEAGLLGQLSGIYVGFALASWSILRRPGEAWEVRPARTPLRTILRAQSGGLSASMIAAIYGAIPVIVVGFVQPGAQPAFALLDKIMKQATAALSPVVVVLQGWVPRSAGVAWSRVRLALLVAAATGTVITLSFALVGRQFTGWLGNSEIEVPYLAILLAGLGLAVALIAAVSNQACLVPLGGMRWVITGNAAGAVVGVAAVTAGTALAGVTGAVFGVFLGALVRAIVSLAALAKYRGGKGVPGRRVG